MALRQTSRIRLPSRASAISGREPGRGPARTGGSIAACAAIAASVVPGANWLAGRPSVVAKRLFCSVSRSCESNTARPSRIFSTAACKPGGLEALGVARPKQGGAAPNQAQRGRHQQQEADAKRGDHDELTVRCRAWSLWVRISRSASARRLMRAAVVRAASISARPASLTIGDGLGATPWFGSVLTVSASSAISDSAPLRPVWRRRPGARACPGASRLADRGPGRRAAPPARKARDSSARRVSR